MYIQHIFKKIFLIKIGQALDFEDVNLIDSKQAKIYDFIVLPQPKIKLVADNLTDLTINTISMGE